MATIDGESLHHGSVDVRLSGEIDLGSRDEVLRFVRDTLESEPSSIALDLGAVTFIDCCGLGAILVARRDADVQGCRLWISGMSPRVRRLLDLTDLLELTVEPDSASS